MDDVRRRSCVLLLEAGIPMHPHLPPIDERPLRSGRQVAARVVASYCLAGLANGANGEAMLRWVSSELDFDIFEPGEVLRLRRKTLTLEMLNEASWHQESLYAGLWALSVVERMTWPSQCCDLTEHFSSMPPEVNAREFLENAVLRTNSELVQEADLYYCLDASLRHGDLWNGEAVEGRYPMVQIVMARRRMLDWILRDCAWSEVSLDV